MEVEVNFSQHSLRVRKDTANVIPMKDVDKIAFGKSCEIDIDREYLRI